MLYRSSVGPISVTIRQVAKRSVRPIFVHEAISPQEQAAWRKKFRKKSKSVLLAIRAEIDSALAVSASKERATDAEIAQAHFDPI